jgi:hypothetical protein
LKNFPNEVPWPGRLRTLLLLSKNLDAGRDQEFHKNDRRSHTSALGELFIADEWAGVQAKVYDFDSHSSTDSHFEGKQAIS